MNDWLIYQGTGKPHQRIKKLPPPPPWRGFDREPQERTHRIEELNPHYVSSSNEEIELVNAALYLRRPLMVTGDPGTGKSSLARAIAYELRLGKVLYWPITSRSTLQEGLYSYDAIGRLQESHLGVREGQLDPPSIGKYIRLGPLGTALLPTRDPRVLLIDEIDKSDMDFPNDLLHVFEEGSYEIPELARLPEEQGKVEVVAHDGSSATIEKGKVACCAFPFVLMTSNREKEFPPPFLRRCIRMRIERPNDQQLAKIVKKQMKGDLTPIHWESIMELIKRFLGRGGLDQQVLATDQLLNAVYMLARGIDLCKDHESLLKAIFRSLSDD